MGNDVNRGSRKNLQAEAPGRHKITLQDGILMMDGRPCRPRLRSGSIRIGCTEITVEAVEFILECWKIAHRDIGAGDAD